MLRAKVKIPKPFAHFGCWPMMYLWNELGRVNPELEFEPTRAQRAWLWGILEAREVYEQEMKDAGRDIASRLSPNKLVSTEMQTRYFYKDKRDLKHEIGLLKRQRDYERSSHRFKVLDLEAEHSMCVKGLSRKILALEKENAALRAEVKKYKKQIQKQKVQKKTQISSLKQPKCAQIMRN